MISWGYCPTIVGYHDYWIKHMAWKFCAQNGAVMSCELVSCGGFLHCCCSIQTTHKKRKGRSYGDYMKWSITAFTYDYMHVYTVCMSVHDVDNQLHLHAQPLSLSLQSQICPNQCWTKSMKGIAILCASKMSSISNHGAKLQQLKRSYLPSLHVANQFAFRSQIFLLCLYHTVPSFAGWI